MEIGGEIGVSWEPTVAGVDFGMKKISGEISFTSEFKDRGVKIRITPTLKMFL